MAYTPPSAAFVDGTTIVSADVDDNLEAMGAYINGGVVAADLTGFPANPIKQQHLAHGSYNPISNQLQMISGVAGGYNSFASDRSFIVSSPTARSIPTTPQDMTLQNSNISFYLAQPANVFFNFFVSCVFPPISNVTPINNYAQIQVYLDDTPYGQTIMAGEREIMSTGSAAIGIGSNVGLHKRSPWSGVYAKPNLGVGHHHSGLRGHCEGHYVMMVSWGVSLEAYYV